jgi:hypothetical protein
LIAQLLVEMGLGKNKSKLFCTPFGLHLEVDDVDIFIFLDNFFKKLVYWCFTHLSLAKNTLIVHQMLFWYGKRVYQ